MISFVLIAWLLAGVVFFIMYQVGGKGKFRLLDSQGKMAALLMVILIVVFFMFFGNSFRFNDQAYVNKAIIDQINDGNDQRLDGWKESPKYDLHQGQEKPLSSQSKVVNEPVSEDKKIYGIMFDAGSTGSRIHAFRFRLSSQGTPLVLEDELFEQVKPGLSSYADDPVKGAESLRNLMDQGKKYIPESHWKQTPIALKATAGLRLLPKEKADALLDEVRKLFAQYPFKVVDNAVSIMEGLAEGVYSWYTVNFFDERLQDKLIDVTKTSGVMDLGGGSTQITFIPQHAESQQATESLTEVNVFGNKYNLYSKSYLGLGLMSGRFQILGGKERSNEVIQDKMESPCFKSGSVTFFVHGGKNYTIKGQSITDAERYAACSEKTKALLKRDEYKITQSAETKTSTFTIISYYYDAATQAKLISTHDGDKLKVSDYTEAAKKVCSSPTDDLPFLCLDLCYMSALLQDGFGFTPEQSVLVRKKIHGKEISWALGAMIPELDIEGVPMLTAPAR